MHVTNPLANLSFNSVSMDTVQNTNNHQLSILLQLFLFPGFSSDSSSSLNLIKHTLALCCSFQLFPLFELWHILDLTSWTVLDKQFSQCSCISRNKRLTPSRGCNVHYTSKHTAIAWCSYSWLLILVKQSCPMGQQPCLLKKHIYILLICKRKLCLETNKMLPRLHF